MGASGIRAGLLLGSRQKGRSGTTGGFNPLTAIAWHSAYWAEDPAWTKPAANAQLTTFTDGSGNGRTLTQSGTGPLYRPSIATLNNQPGIEFGSGGNGWLSSAAFTALTDPWSLVLILDPTGLVGNQSQQRWHDNFSIGASRTYFGQWDAATYIAGGSTLIAGPAPTVAPQVVSMVSNGASSKINLNGTDGAAAPGISSPTTGLRLGGDSTGGSNYIGYLAFAALFAGDITAHAQWAAFKAWVTSHYGIATV